MKWNIALKLDIYIYACVGVECVLRYDTVKHSPYLIIIEWSVLCYHSVMVLFKVCVILEAFWYLPGEIEAKQ